MKNSQKLFMLLAILILIISAGITCFSAAQLKKVDNKVEDVENELKNLMESGQKDTKGQEVRDLKCERDKIDNKMSEVQNESQEEKQENRLETDLNGKNGESETQITETEIVENETEFSNGCTVGIDPGHQGSCGYE